MNDKLKKMIKADKICFIVGIVFIVLIGLCGAWAYSIYATDMDNAPQLTTVDSIESLAYINTKVVPYSFAANSDESEWMAIAMDENNYLYIVRLTNEQYDTIENYFNENEDGLFKITGATKEIESNIKEFAIEAYNEDIVEEDFLDDTNFNDYFGYYYLEMDGWTKDYSSPIVVAMMLVIFGGYFIIRGIKSKVVTKNTVNSEEFVKAMEEVNSPEWETKKAILTKNYIVYADGGLKIIDYKDVLWVYRHTYRYNGVPNHSLAYYVKGSKKMHLISYGFSEKTVDEMVVYIGKKNPKVLVGYTNENKELFKERV